jgi:hypothetical protein
MHCGKHFSNAVRRFGQVAARPLLIFSRPFPSQLAKLFQFTRPLPVGGLKLLRLR